MINMNVIACVSGYWEVGIGWLQVHGHRPAPLERGHHLPQEADCGVAQAAGVEEKSKQEQEKKQ